MDKLMFLTFVFKTENDYCDCGDWKGLFRAAWLFKDCL